MHKKWIALFAIIFILLNPLTCSPCGSDYINNPYPYQDDGQGIMIIERTCSPETIKEEYLKWKKDYPDRAKKTIGIAITGEAGVFMLLYKTD